MVKTVIVAPVFRERNYFGKIQIQSKLGHAPFKNTLHANFHPKMSRHTRSQLCLKNCKCCTFFWSQEKGATLIKTLHRKMIKTHPRQAQKVTHQQAKRKQMQVMVYKFSLNSIPCSTTIFPARTFILRAERLIFVNIGI